MLHDIQELAVISDIELLELVYAEHVSYYDTYGYYVALKELVAEIDPTDTLRKRLVALRDSGLDWRRLDLGGVYKAETRRII